MIQKMNGKVTCSMIFAALLCATSFLLAGCGDYYKSEKYLNLTTKQKIVEVLRREGTARDEYLVYQIDEVSDESKFETSLVYDTIDDSLMLTIYMEHSSSPGYKEMFATMVTEDTYNVYIGELTYCGVEICSGGELYYRTRLLELSTLSVTTFEGDESYKDVAGVFAALGLKMAVLMIHNAFTEYEIDFLWTYFA